MGVGPGDPFAVAGVVHAVRIRKEAAIRNKLFMFSIIALKFGVGINAQEEDAVAVAGRDRSLKAERTVGEPLRTGGVFAD